MDTLENCVFLAPVFSAQHATGSALTASDMPVAVESGGEVRALQRHGSPLWAPLPTASALLLHLQVAV